MERRLEPAAGSTAAGGAGAEPPLSPPGDTACPRRGRTAGAPSERGVGWSSIVGSPRWLRGFWAQRSLFPPALPPTWTRGRTLCQTLQQRKRRERTSGTRGCVGRTRGSCRRCPAAVGGDPRGRPATERFLPPKQEAAAPLAVCRCRGRGGNVGGWHLAGHPTGHPNLPEQPTGHPILPKHPPGHPVLPGRPCCRRTLHRRAQPHVSPHRGGRGRRAQRAHWGGESWGARGSEPRGGPWVDTKQGHVGLHALCEPGGKMSICGVGSPPSSLLRGELGVPKRLGVLLGGFS